jgi:hypothetical protein
MDADPVGGARAAGPGLRGQGCGVGLETAAKDHVRDTLDPRRDADVFASERPERAGGERG